VDEERPAGGIAQEHSNLHPLDLPDLWYEEEDTCSSACHAEEDTCSVGYIFFCLPAALDLPYLCFRVWV